MKRRWHTFMLQMRPLSRRQDDLPHTHPHAPHREWACGAESTVKSSPQSQFEIFAVACRVESTVKSSPQSQFEIFAVGPVTTPERPLSRCVTRSSKIWGFSRHFNPRNEIPDENWCAVLDRMSVLEKLANALFRTGISRKIHQHSTIVSSRRSDFKIGGLFSILRRLCPSIELDFASLLHPSLQNNRIMTLFYDRWLSRFAWESSSNYRWCKEWESFLGCAAFYGASIWFDHGPLLRLR